MRANPQKINWSDKNELYTQTLNPQKNIIIIDNKDIFKFQGQILKRQANLH